MTEYGYVRVSSMDQNEERPLKQSRVPTGIKDYNREKQEFKRCTF